MPQLHLASRFGTLLTRWRLALRGARPGPRFFALGGVPRLRGRGAIRIGTQVNMQCDIAPVWLEAASGAHITIGDRAFLNAGVEVTAHLGVTIGAHCRIGPHCALVDTNHHPVHQDDPVRVAPITLGRNVWLGRSVIVLPGTTIGDHSVVAAGSVVSGTIPPGQVWRGNPATYVKDVRCTSGFIRP